MAAGNVDVGETESKQQNVIVAKEYKYFIKGT